MHILDDIYRKYIPLQLALPAEDLCGLKLVGEYYKITNSYNYSVVH